MDEPLSAAGVESGLRMAATVILVRDGEDGSEVCLLRRHRRSGFAADAWVFPGGVVDDADRRLERRLWDGIEPHRLTQRFGLSADLVLGLHVAAVRETWEEAGVLLARGRAGHPDGAPGPAARTDLRRWLHDRGLVLDLGALEYWSRWVTPRAEPRRYDACFFLAAAPPGQARTTTARRRPTSGGSAPGKPSTRRRRAGCGWPTRPGATSPSSRPSGVVTGAWPRTRPPAPRSGASCPTPSGPATAGGGSSIPTTRSTPTDRSADDRMVQ